MPNNNWSSRSEAVRAASLKRGIVSALGFAIAVIAFAGQKSISSSLLQIGIIAVGSLIVTYAVIDFFVRVKIQDGRPSYLILLPGDPQNPNSNTYPFRLVIDKGHIMLFSRSEVVKRWAFDDVYDIAIKRVWSLRPLGYLSLKTNSGESVTGRIFQPKPLQQQLAAINKGTS